uniref:Uncharacterized protein n=1 Tax=Oryza rufipogon TaxID=4529 RepID=A0A0E0QML9_ORYRU
MHRTCGGHIVGRHGGAGGDRRGYIPSDDGVCDHLERSRASRGEEAAQVEGGGEARGGGAQWGLRRHGWRGEGHRRGVGTASGGGGGAARPAPLRLGVEAWWEGDGRRHAVGTAATRVERRGALAQCGDGCWWRGGAEERRGEGAGRRWTTPSAGGGAARRRGEGRVRGGDGGARRRGRGLRDSYLDINS